MEFTTAIRREDHDRWSLRGERPEFGHGDRRFAEEFEQQRFELVVGSIDLVDQQHRRNVSGVPDRLQQRPIEQEFGREEIGTGDVAVGSLGEADGEHLARIVPLVERLGGGDALVALEPDQRRAQ